MSTQTVEDKLSNLTKYLLALLTGAVVLFPTITGAFKPPYIFDWALYLFWGAATLGMVFLAIAFYLSTFVNKAPQRSAGLGTWLTTLALFGLVVYVGANVISDRTTPPSIVSVVAEPQTAAPNQWIKLTATATDQDDDALSWTWSITPAPTPATPLGSQRVTYWKIPANADAGDYQATIEVKDDRDRSSTGNVTITVKGSKMSTQPDPGNLKSYITDRVKLHGARVVRADASKRGIVNSATDTLVDSAVKNLKSLDAVRDDPRSLNDALDNYFDIPEPDLKKAQFRPCCSRFPGTWPFCDPGC